MKKIYNINGDLRWFTDGEAPEGAILHSKAKKVVEPVKVPEPETKAKKATANKSRKAGSNK